MKKRTMLIATMVAVLTFFGTGLGVTAATVYTTHTVQSGDTVYQLAAHYGVETSALVNANGLADGGYWIYPGQTLYIDSNAKSNSYGNYTVQSGDTLSRLAQQHGTTVAALKNANGLTADRIYIGQTLLVTPKGNPDNTATTTPTTVSTGSLSENELYMLAKMIYAEARGESYQGQVAVGAVIMNRIESPDFPNTLRGVLFQKNQFTAVSDGQYNLTPNDTALAAASEAANGSDPTGHALYYWNPDKASNAYLNSRSLTAVIGNHVFAR